MSRRVLLGLDIGGSSVKFIVAPAAPLTDRQPEPLRRGTIPTPRAEVVAGLTEVVAGLAGGDSVAGLGVNVPGIVDEERGRVIRSANLPHFDGVELSSELELATGVPARVLNDGRAAAAAEARWGAGRGHRDVFSIALGTGIAGAHVSDGVVVAGAHGAAGELGHVSLDPHGSLCSCGRRGCLETIVGAPALGEAWNRVGGEGSPKDLLAAFEAGDARAVPVVDQATDALAEGVLTLIALIDPGCIVVGGGLASAPHALVKETAVKVAARATFHHVPPIVPAELGAWAGAWGAVMGAAERLEASTGLLTPHTSTPA